MGIPGQPAAPGDRLAIIGARSSPDLIWRNVRPVEPWQTCSETRTGVTSAMTPETFSESRDAGASLDVDEFLVLIKDLELSK